MIRPKKVCFVLIKDGQVQTSETVEADSPDSIWRRLDKIQHEGFSSATAVYNDGQVGDIHLPVSDRERVDDRFRKIMDSVENDIPVSGEM